MKRRKVRKTGYKKPADLPTSTKPVLFASLNFPCELTNTFLSFFRTIPSGLFELTGVPDPGKCHMASESQKKVINMQLSTDSVIRPIETAQAIYLTEFLLSSYYGDPYINLVQKMTLIHDAEIPLSKPRKKKGAGKTTAKQPARRRRSGKPKRDVVGILIISKSLHDPQTPPWCKIVKTLVFEDIARTFCEQNPDHPLTHLLRPLIVEDQNELERQANDDYAALRELVQKGEISSQVTDAWLDLLWQRFKDRPIEEIKKMITFEEVDMKNTVGGRQILEDGKELGMEAVLIKQATKRFGELGSDLEDQIRSLSIKKLDDLTLAILDLETKLELESWLAEAKKSES